MKFNGVDVKNDKISSVPFITADYLRYLFGATENHCIVN